METSFFQLAEQIYKANRDLFDDLRKQRNQQLLLLGFTSLLITPALLSFVLSFNLRYHVPLPSPWLLAIPCFLLCGICLYPGFNNTYRSIAKKPFLSGLAAQMGLTFHPGGAMRLGDLYDHNLLPSYTTREVEEGFKGRINGFDFEFQDFTVNTVSRFVRFDTRSRFDQRFYGIAMRIHLNRTFRHHTVLIPSSMNYAFNEKFVSYENIDLVFKKFHQSYTIISKNQVEARVIFDPAMIERIMTLGEKLDANWFGISFKDREMVIVAGQSRNFFEIGSLLRFPSVLTIEKALNEIALFRSVLEILELNPHTGTGTVLPSKTI